MSTSRDRPCPSGQQHARPAARSAAVRPRAASPSCPGASRAPRPAAASARASPSLSSLFFMSRAPAQWGQLCWLAKADWRLGPGGVGTGTVLETLLGTPKRLIFRDLRQSSHRSQWARAHVIRSRARALALSLLSMGTWEQTYILRSAQWLKPFPRRSPAAVALGTWERSETSPGCPDRLVQSVANKIGGEYAGAGPERPICGLLQGVRGETFGLGGAIEVSRRGSGELPAALTRRATWRSRNGGFPPFLGGRIGHVGRAMLEGSGQGADRASFFGARRKLASLPGLALAGELAAPIAAQLEQLLDQADAGAIAAGAGTPPNRAAEAPCMPPQTVFSVSSGFLPDGSCSGVCGEGGSIWNSQWGPGGFSSWSLGRKVGARPQSNYSGERAGDDVPSGSSRPPGGEAARLGWGHCHVNA